MSETWVASGNRGALRIDSWEGDSAQSAALRYAALKGKRGAVAVFARERRGSRLVGPVKVLVVETDIRVRRKVSVCR